MTAARMMGRAFSSLFHAGGVARLLLASEGSGQESGRTSQVFGSLQAAPHPDSYLAPISLARGAARLEDAGWANAYGTRSPLRSAKGRQEAISLL